MGVAEIEIQFPLRTVLFSSDEKIITLPGFGLWRYVHVNIQGP